MSFLTIRHFYMISPAILTLKASVDPMSVDVCVNTSILVSSVQPSQLFMTSGRIVLSPLSKPPHCLILLICPILPYSYFFQILSMVFGRYRYILAWHDSCLGRGVEQTTRAWTTTVSDGNPRSGKTGRRLGSIAQSARRSSKFFINAERSSPLCSRGLAMDGLLIAAVPEKDDADA
jgi:hypothetical protein